MLQMDADVGSDIVTALRSDLAALQYKRDKLLSEVSVRIGFYLNINYLTFTFGVLYEDSFISSILMFQKQALTQGQNWSN
jgi:hypothetical protein